MSNAAEVPPGDVGKIIVRPGRLKGQDGWEVWEDPQICPFYLERRQAIDYALGRGDGRRTLEVRDASGAVLRSLTGPEWRAFMDQRALEAL